MGQLKYYLLTKIDQSQKNQGKEIRELFCNSMVSDGMHGTPAGSPINGCTSLGPSALKTATQVQGQHKYLIGDLKKSNICVDKHPSVSIQPLHVYFV